MSEGDSRTYVSMMLDSLKKKKEILHSILDMTKEQENILRSDEIDVDRFQQTIDEKGIKIDQLDKIDSGFDSLYKKLEKELMGNQASYASEIAQMKSLISDITEMSTSVQVLEKKNHERFKQYVSDERLRLREASKQQQTVQTYAQNMVGAHKPGNSYFVNETK